MKSKEVIDIRKKAGLSQTEFGKKLGVSLRTIQNWESGHNIPRSKQLLISNMFSNYLKNEDLDSSLEQALNNQ